jgi:hypothetical protein
MAIDNALHVTCRAHDISRDSKLRRNVERSIAGGGRKADGTVKKGVRDRRDRDERIMWWADKAGVHRWDNIQIGRAGTWGLECVYNALSDVFYKLPVAGGGPEIYEDAVDHAAAIADQVLLRRPARFPSTRPALPWTDLDVGGYGPDHAAGLAQLLQKATGRACQPVQAPFVRDWHPDTRRNHGGDA